MMTKCRQRTAPQRFSAASPFFIGALLLLGVLGVTDEGPLLELSLVKVMLTGAALLAAAGYGLRATVRVSDGGSENTAPLDGQRPSL